MPKGSAELEREAANLKARTRATPTFVNVEFPGVAEKGLEKPLGEKKEGQFDLRLRKRGEEKRVRVEKNQHVG